MIFFEKSMSMSVQSILVAHHSGRIIVVSVEQQVFPVTVYEFPDLQVHHTRVVYFRFYPELLLYSLNLICNIMG